MSKRFRKLSHTLDECKYHVVFCPKYRYRILKNEVAQYTRQQIYQLLRQKEGVEVLELNVQADHIHLVLWIPPKYAVSVVLGYVKGKKASATVPAVRAVGAQLLGAPLVGAGLLRQHGGRQRRADPPVRAVAGEEGA